MYNGPYVLNIELKLNLNLFEYSETSRQGTRQGCYNALH